MINVSLEVGSKYPYKKIVGLDDPHPFGCTIEVVVNRLSSNVPLLSIVVPMFNKGEIIDSILESIVQNVSNTFELIVIDDCSSDQSLSNAINFLEKKDFQFLVLKASTPIFETACDNVGFALARGKFFLEIQSDIHIKEYGFDDRLKKVASISNISSVSGRCAHSWLSLYSGRMITFKLFIHKFLKIKSKMGSLDIGMVNHHIFEKSLPKSVNTSSYYCGDTNNRGPWMLTAENYFKFGPLDSVNFFLGGDDHFFNFKASMSGLVAAYVPIRLETIAEEGSTRQKRFGLNKDIYEHMLRSKKGNRKLLLRLLFKQFNFIEEIKNFFGIRG
jgi:glycosyltransferase involved in cell wall biosynthesis